MTGRTLLPAVPANERPEHPLYGRALSGQPYDVDGFVFWPFRRGIALMCRATSDGRIAIFGCGKTFVVLVDGQAVARNKRSERTAAAAGIAFLKAKDSWAVA